MMGFMKGADSCCLNAKKIISAVGTRWASDYCKAITDNIVNGLSHLDDLMLVSGLAYGIDVAAHKASLKYDIPTLGVLANDIDFLYESMHTQLFRQIQETDALIIAAITNSYNIDVFAVPGRVGDENSEGCNQLIRRNQEALVQSARDMLFNYLGC